MNASPDSDAVLETEELTRSFVEGGRERLNESVKISVTSVLQTSAGRMVFGRMDSAKEASREKSREG